MTNNLFNVFAAASTKSPLCERQLLAEGTLPSGSVRTIHLEGGEVAEFWRDLLAREGIFPLSWGGDVTITTRGGGGETHHESTVLLPIEGGWVTWIVGDLSPHRNKRFSKFASREEAVQELLHKSTVSVDTMVLPVVFRRACTALGLAHLGELLVWERDQTHKRLGDLSQSEIHRYSWVPEEGPWWKNHQRAVRILRSPRDSDYEAAHMAVYILCAAPDGAPMPYPPKEVDGGYKSTRCGKLHDGIGAYEADASKFQYREAQLCCLGKYS